MYQLLTSEGKLKDWNRIKREFQLTDNLYNTPNSLKVETNAKTK